MNETQRKLPADPGAMVLGIISLVICLVGCCCGLLAIPSIVMSVIGIIWSINSQKAYNASPHDFLARSYNNVKTAKIINIIAAVLGSLILIGSIAWFGNIMLDPEEFFENLENGEFVIEEQIDEEQQEEPMDTLIDDWEYRDESTDSLPTQ